MEKRTILFVILLTILFYGVHFWFGQGQKPAIITTETQEYPPVKSELAVAKNLPIFQLYYDEAGTQLATYAVGDEDHYLTMAWKKDLPSTLYVKTLEDNISVMEMVQLNVVEKDNIGSLVIYSIYLAEKIPASFLSNLGDFDVQLVCFTHDNQNYQAIPGVIHNNQLIQLQQTPPVNALILYEKANTFIPFGIYNVKDKQVTRLLDMIDMQNKVLAVYPENIDIVPLPEKSETYYKLETPYQQLVFSNLNGAIAEVNLSLKSKQNPNNVVRPIDIDRIMEKKYPIDDYYPQYPYYEKDQKGALTLITDRTLGGYYPLLRRNILEQAGKISSRVPPHDYLCSILQEQQVSETQIYTLKRYEKNLIEFELVQPNRRILKTYTLPENTDEAPYCFDLTIKIDGDAKGLLLNMGIPEAELISGSFSPTLKYRITRNQKSQIEQISIPKPISLFSSIQPDWLCNGNGFFGIILDPLTEAGSGFIVHNIPGQVAPTRLTVIDSEYGLYPVEKYPGYQMHLPIRSFSGTSKFRIFAGPFDRSILNKVDQTYTDPKTGASPDYIGVQSFHGFFAFISEPFAKFLLIIMRLFYQLTHSWGFSIILLTAVLRIMLYPLNNWSIKSTIKLQDIAPKVAAIQEKFRRDPKRAQQEIVLLYRERGVNPLSGCFPLLIQIPFLMGMFDLLKSTFELRGASFIPGWINNLTAPDVVFSWDYPLFFIGNQFHLLPILLGIIMYLQQKMSSPHLKRAQSIPDQQKQQKMMGNIMTIVFTVMFYHFPSGLNIYWLSSMLLGMLQQWWTMKKMKPS